MKQTISMVLGRLLCLLTRLRDRAQSELWKGQLGSVDPTAVLEYPLDMVETQRIHIGAGSRLQAGSSLCPVASYGAQKFDPEIRIGQSVHVGHGAHLVATKRIVIEDNVLLADHVFISDNLHEYRDVSRPISKNDLICCGEVRIGEGSWIGEKVSIIGDVRIGRNCVVGANAVLRSSLPDFSVAVGVPARIIRRYHPERRRWESTDPHGVFHDELEKEGPAADDRKEAAEVQVRSRQ